MVGAHGVQIVLSSTPGTTAPMPSNPELRRGRSVVVRGRTYPMLRDARLSLRVAYPELRTTTFRHIRTDRRGRFSTTVKLTQLGRAEIGARYQRDLRRPGLLGDYSCPLGFAVVR